MATKARCKFMCGSVQKFQSNERVFLDAVYEAGAPEDDAFSKYTPSGSMQFIVDNPSLDGFFVPGKKYYIDITES